MIITRTDFRNKPPFEQLDFILTQFVNNDRFKGNMSDIEVIKALFGEGDAPMGDITGSVIIDILRKLCKDEYLNSWTATNNTLRYALTFEGRTFYQTGMYQTDQKKKKQKENEQSIHNYVLSGGALIAGIYSLIELAKWISSFFFVCNNH
jgi:hypothetical protein